MGPEPVIMIGAGVTSLSTAYTILSENPQTPLLIIAAELPTDPASSWTADYASMWAGAHYRPIAPSSDQEQNEFQLAVETCAKMRNIAKECPEAGVAVLPAIEYMENPRPAEVKLKTGDVYACKGDNFRVLNVAELPDGVEWGCEYETYCVNVTTYCKWLLQQVQKKGGYVVKRQLATPEEAFSIAEELGMTNPKVVINCSGRGFDKDTLTYPVRGQTVLVRQQYHKTITRQCRDGTWAFLIPRPNAGGTIVGGTKEVRNLNTQSSPDTRRTLLKRATECFPDFVNTVDKFEVLKDNVGRRPARQGGSRVEVEMLSGSRRLIHGYGAGGRGYEISWGIAARLNRLVQTSKPLQCSL